MTAHRQVGNDAVEWIREWVKWQDLVCTEISQGPNMLVRCVPLTVPESVPGGRLGLTTFCEMQLSSLSISGRHIAPVLMSVWDSSSSSGSARNVQYRLRQADAMD